MRGAWLIRWFATLAILVFPVISAADVVTEWNEQALACATAAKQPPFVAARTMAMVHAAMFDAVNSVEGHYSSYRIKEVAPPATSPQAAGVAAAHTVLIKLCSDQKAALDAAYGESLARIPEGGGKVDGVSLGERVGLKVLALRATDGADATSTYKPETTPGRYVVTTLPAGSQWGAVTPWVMERGSQFRPAPPPQLTSVEWARDYNEIKDMGGTKSTIRTTEQTNIARFWTITGPQSWDLIVRQLASAPNRTLSGNARLFALVEMAAADAYIGVFDAKYTFNFWRPITAIRNGDNDGNEATVRQADWVPLVDTPLHPEYPCAHCITSAAVAAVLQSEFGKGAIPLVTMTSPTAPGVDRKWTSIQAWADEVSEARICGGLHYRNSTMVGKAMGTQIGELAVRHYLQPIP
jgi:hypothetical protein